MILFPLVYPLFAYVLFELGMKGLLSIVLSPLFYLCSLFWIFSGIGIRKLKKWSWYTFLLGQAILVYLNALNLVENSNSEFKLWSFMFTILIQGYFFSVISKEIRVPYLFPKIHWWESGIVGMPHLSVSMTHAQPQSASLNGQILDLSLKGCFIKSHHDFKLFEGLQVVIEAFHQRVELKGVVIWNAKSTVTHPKGIGIRFSEMDRKTRKHLKLIVMKFQKQKESGHEQKLHA